MTGSKQGWCHGVGSPQKNLNSKKGLNNRENKPASRGKKTHFGDAGAAVSVSLRELRVPKAIIQNRTFRFSRRGRIAPKSCSIRRPALGSLVSFRLNRNGRPWRRFAKKPIPKPPQPPGPLKGEKNDPIHRGGRNAIGRPCPFQVGKTTSQSPLEGVRGGSVRIFP